MKKISFLLILLFSSCAVFAENQTTQKLVVVLDSATNTMHAPLVIADQLGYFKEQGLDVTFNTPATSHSPTKMLVEKKADIALTYEPWFIENVDRGVPVIRIGTLIDKPLNCVVALSRSGIKAITDLKGKEIGQSNDKLTNAVLTTMLKDEGMSADEYKVIDVQQNLINALLSHRVDAISGMSRNLDVAQIEKAGQKVVVFFPEEHGVPTYSEVIFISNIANAKDSRFPKFLSAVKKAVRYLDEHPEAAWNQFAQTYPKLNTPLNREFWFKTLPYFAEEPAEFDRSDWRKFTNFMQEHRLITKTQEIERYSNIG